MHLLLYLSVSLPISAIHVFLKADAHENRRLVQKKEGNKLITRASDRTAGIGFEFESGSNTFELESKCEKEDTDASRKQIIAGRTGEHFQLTADAFGGAGRLHAEYILDGLSIKVGTGDAARAGAAVAADFVSI